MRFKVNKKYIGDGCETYFIADIAANHDGNLDKARELVKLCAEAGANAAKFQHFKAKTIVSDYAFNNLVKSESHQTKWKKSVFKTYEEASIAIEWCIKLKETCDECDIDFFTSPYDLDYVDQVDDYICAFKIGSGDISWPSMLKKISKKNKPIFIATGASTYEDVNDAYNLISKNNSNIVLMQCNTNYTANDDINIKNLNLNVLDSYKKNFPKIILGLSDHTLSNLSVIASVSKGAKVIEKHFTDSNQNYGPDHKFSLNPTNWKKMIDEVRLLELALGDGVKKVEDNEKTTYEVQRRCVCAKNKLLEGRIIKKEDLICLRPSLKNTVQPKEIENIINLKLKKTKESGEPIFWSDFK